MKHLENRLKRAIVAFKRTYEPTPADDILDILSRYDAVKKKRILDAVTERIRVNLRAEQEHTKYRLEKITKNLAVFTPMEFEGYNDQELWQINYMKTNKPERCQII